MVVCAVVYICNPICSFAGENMSQHTAHLPQRFMPDLIKNGKTRMNNKELINGWNTTQHDYHNNNNNISHAVDRHLVCFSSWCEMNAPQFILCCKLRHCFCIQYVASTVRSCFVSNRCAIWCQRHTVANRNGCCFAAPPVINNSIIRNLRIKFLVNSSKLFNVALISMFVISNTLQKLCSIISKYQSEFLTHSCLRFNDIEVPLNFAL